MRNTRFDSRTFLLVFGAALLGAAWAIYNRSTLRFPYGEDEFRSLVWVIFATPLGLFLGWFVARPAERWWALLASFCVYFFTPFVAARYESCTVVRGHFSLVSCFADTQQAQQLASASGHTIYFGAIVVVQVVIALAIALHRAAKRSTIPAHAPIPNGQQTPGLTD